MYYGKLIKTVVGSVGILSLSACSVILGPQEGANNPAPPATQNSVPRSQLNVNGNVSKADQNSAANDFVNAKSGTTVSASVETAGNGAATDTTVTADVPTNQSQSQNISQTDSGTNRATSSSAVTIPNTTVKDVHANRVQQVGSGHLVVKSPYNQVWSQVGKALPSAGYQIMDTDSSLGNYSVSDTTGSGGVIKHDTPVYMVHLEKQGDNSTLVTVSSSNSQSTAGMSQLYSTLKNKLQ